MPQRVELQDVPSPSEENQPKMPMPVPVIIAQVSREVLDLGTLESNDVTKSIGKITIYFSQMCMTEVYALQNVAVA